jgi:pimeloyl-ACP methyl ester carboxylesterase
VSRTTRRCPRRRSSTTRTSRGSPPIWKSSLPFTSNDLRGINLPELVIHGEHDEIVKTEHAREMAKRIPGARLRVFEDASHFVLWQDPAGFNQAVVEFLTSSAPRRP